MSARFLVVNGHPDPRPERFCHALCASYEHGAQAAGFETHCLEIGRLDYPFAEGNARLAEATRLLDWADRLAIVFPLWLDAPPPVLCAFLARAAERSQAPHFADRSAAARAARIVVTMDMPAFMLRSKFRDTSDAFALPGVLAREATFIGAVASISAEARKQWLDAVRNFGLHGC